MARQLLLKTLVGVLGEFVDGLTEDNLKVGVWSGVIVLEKLSLNREGIKKLHLPIEVKHGYIGSLRVCIPWARLTSESVTIEIQDVFLLANPVDPKSWDPDDLQHKNLEAKRALLEKLSQAPARARDEKGGKEDSGYFAKLAAKIADNIFIYLKDIHIRYEDPVSDPQGVLSMGITIQDFQIQTTDGQWNPTFVSRDDKKGGSAASNGAIYKKADMRGFAVYWSPRVRKLLGNANLDSFLEVMKLYAEAPQMEGLEPLTYLIHPNSLSIKLIHNENGNPAMPKFSADVELSESELSVQTEQYQQILMVKETFDLCNRLQLLLPYRPKHRPSRGRTKEWWKYALFCVTKPKKNAGILEVLELIRRRKAYLSLYEKVVTKQPLSDDETAQLDAIEEAVNLTALVIWRKIVRMTVKQKRRQARLQQQQQKALLKQQSSQSSQKGAAAPPPKAHVKSQLSTSSSGGASVSDSKGKSGGGGWFSWFGGGGKKGEDRRRVSSVDDDSETSESEEEKGSGDEDDDGILIPPDGVPEGDISIDELVAQADMQATAMASSKPNQDLFQVQLSTRGVIRLMGLRRKPLMELRASFKCQAAQKGESITVGLQLPTFEVLDQHTPTAVFTKIAEVSRQRTSAKSAAGNVFDLSLRTSPGETSVTIRTRPINLAYNRGWVAELIKLFRPPPDVSEALMKRAVDNIGTATAAAGEALKQMVKLHADLEIASPRIFVPLTESIDHGFLILDPGTLSLKGGTLPSDSSSSAWDLRLSDIGSSLPSCKDESMEASGQLIDPFAVSVSLRINGPETIKAAAGTALAATSVRLDLQPRIRGVVNPHKLKTLLCILTNLGLPDDGGGEEDLLSKKRAAAIGQSAMQRMYGDDNFEEAAADALASRRKEAPPPPPAEGGEPQHEDPATRTMEVLVEIPQVVLELQSDSPAQDDPAKVVEAETTLFILSVDRLKLDMVNRPYDSDMQVVLSGLAIEDFARPAAEGVSRYMAQSFAPSDSSLISFHMVSIIDRKLSPLFNGYDSEMELTFAQLELKLAPMSLRVFKPFYQAFVNYEEVQPFDAIIPLRRSASTVSATSSMATATQAAASGLVAAVQANRDKRMHVVARMASVSVELLAYKEALPGSGGAATCLPVIMAEIVGLSADVRMQEEMAVDLSLESFEVSDTQPASAENAIRKLICPKAPEVDADDEEQDEKKEEGEAVARAKQPLLTVQVQEKKEANEYAIDVALVDFTMHVLVEAILASIDVTLETVDAVMSMIESPGDAAAKHHASLAGGPARSALAMISEGVGDEESADDGGAEQIRRTASQQPTGPDPIGLCVRVDLKNPQLILVENARNYDSRALTMRGSCAVAYVKRYEGFSVNETVLVDAKGLEAFVDVVGDEASEATQIIEPFAFGVRLNRQSEGEKLLTMDLLLDMHRIDARVAFHDVMLVLFIVNGLSDAATRVSSGEPQPTTTSPSRMGSTVHQSPQAVARSLTGSKGSWDEEGGGEEVDADVPLDLPDEPQKKGSSLTRIKVMLAGIQVVGINDFEEREQPVLSLVIDSADMDFESTGSSYQGNILAAFQARFFNPSVLYWEPLVEPWGLELSMATTMDGVLCRVESCDPKQCKIRGKRKDLDHPVLNINVTDDFLRTMSRTYSLLMSTDTVGLNRAERGGGKYLITNRTGVAVEVDGGCGAVSLPAGETTKLDVRMYRRSRGDGRGWSRREERKPGTVTVSLAHPPLKDQRKPLAKLRVDAPGSLIYPLKPVMETGRTYNQPVVEEVFENERCERVTGRWRAPYLPTDRKRWTDEQGRPLPEPQEVQLPSAEWRWQDEWHVDMGYGEMDKEIDKEGWTYGVEFPGFNLNRIKRTYREMDGVRRRRWIRTRVPIPPELNDPCRPLFLAWTVDVQPDGRTHLSVETTVKVVNETPVPFSLQSLIEPGRPPIDIDAVPANGEIFVPCLLTYAPLLRMRPAGTTGEYNWSSAFLVDKNSGAMETVVECHSAKNDHPVVVIVDVKAGAGAARVLIRPAFVVENMLPCRAHIQFIADLTRPGRPHSMIIGPGSTEGLMTLVPTECQWMQVRVLDLEWSQPEEIGSSTGKLNQLKSFNLQSKNQEEIWISGWVVKPDFSKLRFITTLWTRCWVVDRTGLGLGFCENPTSRRRRATTRFGRRTSRAASLGMDSSGTGFGQPPRRRTSREEPIGMDAMTLVTIVNGSLQVSSDGPYQVLTVDNGSRLYTDSPCRFANLPPRLRRKTCICPPNADRTREDQELIRFSPSGDAEVYVLYDMSGGEATRLPDWIEAEGFAKVEGMVITINTHRREEGVIRLQAFVKKAEARSTVVLGGNKHPGAALVRNNYIALIVRDTDAMQLQPAFGGGGSSQSQGLSGAGDDETLGVLLYDPRRAKMCVAVGEEEAWSKPLDVENPVERGIFEVEGEAFHYDLSLSIDVCPGVFWRTKQVTVTPRFVVVNCLDVDITIRQCDVEAEDKAVLLTSQSRSPFYWASKTAGRKEMQIMINGRTGWSYGGVNIENVGSTAMLLRTTEGADAVQQRDPVVVNVEVKLAEGNEECAVVVAIWMPTGTDPPVYRIDNFTPYEVQFVQTEARKGTPKWVLPAGLTTCYGWEYPCLKHTLTVRVMNPEVDKRLKCEMKLDRVRDQDVLDMGKGKGRIFLRVVAEDGTKVLKIVRHKDLLEPPIKPRGEKELTLSVRLSGVGISLIGADEEDSRRELAYLFIQDVQLEYCKDQREMTMELLTKAVQIDNHSHKAVFPVALCPKTSKSDQPFIHFALSAEIDPTRPTKTSINYLAFRLLAADVQLDLRSLLRFLQFGQHFALLNYEVALAELHPDKYITNLREFYGYAEPLPWVDVASTCETVQSSRVYLERIDLHPLSIALSFVQTVTDGKRVGIYGNLLEVVKNLATISRAPIQLKSFSVEHVMETPARFSAIVLTHYKRQAFNQIFAIAGSLTTFGSPADLLTSVGTGVKDFFYEPINGLVHSPKDFARGLHKGTSSLVKGVVSGALNSVAGVGDTINRNVAMLGFDREYAQEREQRRQTQRTEGTGIVDGLKGGGTSLVRGFADGIGGLVTTPLKEAKTGGVGGFFKGVGKGVLGLAVKPIVGVGDAVVSVIQGASQSALDLEQHSACRPRRALPRLAANGKPVLTDYSIAASRAQEMVEASDAYDSHVSLPDQEVIFTEKTLVMAPSASKATAHKLPWRDISYCQWMPSPEGSEDNRVLLHLYTGPDPVVLDAGDPDRKQVLYEQLYLNASKMGNGAQMRPLEDVLAGQGKEGGEEGGSWSTATWADGYIFGSANDQDLRCRKLRSWNIVARARERLFQEWIPGQGASSWHQLDNAVWKAINDWVKNHRPPLNFRKIIAILIINQSASGIQLRETDFRNGSEVHVIDSPTYDATSRVLSPGGAMLILAWSHLPTLVKKANVELGVDMSAFSGQFTDALATVSPRPGYEAVFLEKTKRPEFCKYVLVVRS